MSLQTCVTVILLRSLFEHYSFSSASFKVSTHFEKPIMYSAFILQRPNTVKFFISPPSLSVL